MVSGVKQPFAGIKNKFTDLQNPTPVGFSKDEPDDGRGYGQNQ